MHALLLVVALTASGPEPGDVVAATSTLPPPTRVPPAPSAVTRALIMTPRVETRPFDETAVIGLIPGGQEIGDWFQHNKADRRWRNGVGLTVNFGFQRLKLTFGLGPVQFSIGGQPAKTVP